MGSLNGRAVLDLPGLSGDSIAQLREDGQKQSRGKDDARTKLNAQEGSGKRVQEDREEVGGRTKATAERGWLHRTLRDGGCSESLRGTQSTEMGGY